MVRPMQFVASQLRRCVPFCSGAGVDGAGEDQVKVLLIEDDQETAAYISRGLRENSHMVEHAADGRDGLFWATDGGYDVLIVDRMLPSLDGLGLVRMLRDSKVRTPVLFLTALGGVGDRVRGLDAGGDDYLAKPFAFAELLARINALARRPPLIDVQTVLHVGDLEMDLLKRTVTRAGKEVELQPREFQLLEYLLRNAERVVTRTMLLEAVWDFHFDPKTNIVETHISRLRSKLARSGGPELIHTVRGSGYALRAPGNSANA
jgi:two-component system, OmpR family, response regulator